MTTAQTLDKMMELLPHITAILEDADTQELRDILRPREGAEKAEVNTPDLLSRLFPLMIVKHRAELYGIICVLSGKTEAEVKEMPFEETKKLLNDEGLMKEFFGFFPWLLQMALRA